MTSRVLRISRHSAEGEHSGGPEGRSIGRALSFLFCQIHVTTSIDRAAIAMMATIARATRTIVMPRSWRREGQLHRNLRIAGGFILPRGFQRTIYRGRALLFVRKAYKPGGLMPGGYRDPNAGLDLGENAASPKSKREAGRFLRG